MKTKQFQLNADFELNHWWFVARRRIVRDLTNRLVPPHKNICVLDVGCGTGGNIQSFSDQYRAVGIDCSPEAIDFARQRFPGVEFVCGYAPQDVNHVLGETRLILLMDVLEHVPDDFALFTSLLSAAKPGTILVLTVPAMMQLWSKHDVSHGHYRRYSMERLQRLWAHLPVTPLIVSYFNSRLYPLIRTVRLFNNLRRTAHGQHDTDLSIPPDPVNRLLTSVFAGERRRLNRLLDGKQKQGYSQGVSLLAILRREEGAVTPISRPQDVAPDEHGPAS